MKKNSGMPDRQGLEPSRDRPVRGKARRAKLKTRRGSLRRPVLKPAPNASAPEVE